MNANYDRGVRFERARKKKWEANDYLVLRTAGSHGAFDLVAVGYGYVYLIQCKVISGGEKAAENLIKAFKLHPPLPPGDGYVQIIEVWANRKLYTGTI